MDKTEEKARCQRGDGAVIQHRHSKREVSRTLPHQTGQTGSIGDLTGVSIGSQSQYVTVTWLAAASDTICDTLYCHTISLLQFDFWAWTPRHLRLVNRGMGVENFIGVRINLMEAHIPIFCRFSQFGGVYLSQLFFRCNSETSCSFDMDTRHV